MIDPSAPLGYPRAPQPPPDGARTATAGRGSEQPPSGGSASPASAGVPPSPGTLPPPAPGARRQPPPGYGYPPPPPPGYGPPPSTPPPSAPQSKQRPRRDPGGLVAGLVIAGVGLFFLAGQLEPDIGRFVTLFIGLALLAVFVVTREYGFLIPGSLLTGVGIGIAIDAAASGAAESGVMMLAIAGGFLGIWVLGSLYRLPQNHWWPLIPGGILTLIGLVQLGRTEVDAALSLWPILLIIAGAFVLARAVTRRG